jgi:hypothetical protein
VTGRLTCADVRDRELIERYAAGTLGGEDAEALEAHAFECEACWQQINRAVEIRASMLADGAAQGTVVPAPRPGAAKWRPFVPMALAATALLGIGLAIVLQQRQTAAPPPVMRGGSADAAEPIATRQADGSIAVEWPPHPAASEYIVTLQVGNVTILRTETSDLRYVLPREQLTAGSPAVVNIEAVSPEGAILWTGSVALSSQ